MPHSQSLLKIPHSRPLVFLVLLTQKTGPCLTWHSHWKKNIKISLSTRILKVDNKTILESIRNFENHSFLSRPYLPSLLRQNYNWCLWDNKTKLISIQNKQSKILSEYTSNRIWSLNQINVLYMEILTDIVWIYINVV